MQNAVSSGIPFQTLSLKTVTKYGNEMNSFETNLFARFDRNRRSGITLIEVLTSILIAVIGVFGVMVMIPFGVSQAEHGLRQEEASALALNAISDFKIRDFANPERWNTVTAGGVLVDLDPLARPYVIDPIGVADRGAQVPALDGGVFPFVSPNVEGTMGMGSPPSEQNVLMNRVTLQTLVPPLGGPFIADTAASTPMSRAVADQLFAWTSDLVVRDATTDDTNVAYPEIDLLPPLQEFDNDSGDNAVRRQARRDMSYIVVAVPAKVAESSPGVDQVFAWRNYFVVYEKRPQPLEFSGVAEQPYDRVYRVVDPGERVAYSGGDLELVELGQTSSQPTEIKRGEWMMLTNVAPSASTLRPSKFIQQVQFYKVVDAEQEGGNAQVTLQGPNFQFPLTDSTDPSSAPVETYAVHLPDVWAVFERTFR